MTWSTSIKYSNGTSMELNQTQTSYFDNVFLLGYFPEKCDEHCLKVREYAYLVFQMTEEDQFSPEATIHK